MKFDVRRHTSQKEIAIVGEGVVCGLRVSRGGIRQNIGVLLDVEQGLANKPKLMPQAFALFVAFVQLERADGMGVFLALHHLTRHRAVRDHVIREIVLAGRIETLRIFQVRRGLVRGDDVHTCRMESPDPTR